MEAKQFKIYELYLEITESNIYAYGHEVETFIVLHDVTRVNSSGGKTRRQNAIKHESFRCCCG